MAMHVETPLIESTELSEANSSQVLLKLENTQPVHSFKIRGIGALCVEAKQAGKLSIVCSSGGNAGLAAAYASKKLEMPCKIFVPRTTPKFTIERLQSEGATVQVAGSIWSEANAEAEKYLESNKDCAFVHPFDHPTIWKGHSTMIHEIKRQMSDGSVPGCVIASVGGGGLLTGVVQGMDAVGWGEVPIIAMETVGAASFAAAIEAGKVVAIPDITSIAKTLGSSAICQQLFDYTKNHKIISQVVTDAEAVDACVKFADSHKMLVEPACGAALAAVYSGLILKLQADGRLPSSLGSIVVIVCGGSSISMDTLRSFQSMFSSSS